MTSYTDEVDILIPSYRPGEKFCRLLEALAAQTGPIGRVIIINTDEKEWTPGAEETVARLSEQKNSILNGPEVHHIRKEEFDHAFARNLIRRYSKAGIFLCMTDDAVPADRYMVERLVERLKEQREGNRACTPAPEETGKIAMVYARQLPGEKDSPAERMGRSFNYPPESCMKSFKDIKRLGIKTFFASNVCCAYDRAVFDELGGFEEPAVFNEDMVYAAKALKNGFSSYYCAEACVYHSHHYTIKEQFRRCFDLGMSQAMHPEVFAQVSSEQEGVRLVLTELKILMKEGKPFQIPGLLAEDLAKFAGYRMGRRYRKLSKRMLLRCTASREFAEKYLTDGGRK